MIVTHKLDRKDCLSHQLWTAIEKGWQDSDKPIHFFWGLAGNNIKEIKECMDKKEEWWYVDVGYLTQQITRYPSPKIHDYDKTYFRIIKGNLHTIRGRVGDGVRLTQLEQKGIDVQFKGWYTGETKHILLAPSSQTVTYHINGMNQEEWIKQVTAEIKKHTDRPIKFRNKVVGNRYKRRLKRLSLFSYKYEFSSHRRCYEYGTSDNTSKKYMFIYYR